MASAQAPAELSLQEQLEQKCHEVVALKEKLREVVAAAECSEERMVNKVSCSHGCGASAGFDACLYPAIVSA